MTSFAPPDAAHGGHQTARLGLALIDAVISAHNGTLQLESRVGIGTVATLCFPPTLVLAAHAETAD